MNTVDLIIACLATWELVEVWHHSSLFSTARARVELWETRAAEMLGCPFCLSPWVALVVVLVLDAALLITAIGPRWLGLLVQAPIVALAVARAANVCNDLMSRKGRRVTLTPRHNVLEDVTTPLDSDGEQRKDMNANHEQLVAKAKSAISEVFSDKSVDRAETKASLVDLRDELELLINAVEN